MALYLKKRRELFRLDVRYPIAFAQNLDQEIENLFNSKYGQKCAMNSYILRMVAIHNKGDLIINHSNLEADAYIDTHLEYECLEISAGDIIPWMTIKSIESGAVALETLIDGMRICAKVMIRSPMFESLAVDQKVCVRVRLIKHETGSNTVCLLGSFYFGAAFTNSLGVNIDSKGIDDEDPNYDLIPPIDSLKRFMEMTCEPVGRSREAANIKFMIHKIPEAFPDEKTIAAHGNVWQLFSRKAQ